MAASVEGGIVSVDPHNYLHQPLISGGLPYPLPEQYLFSAAPQYNHLSLSLPAPLPHIPAPVAHIPAPVAHIPAPVAHIPAPVAHIPAPVAHIPAPIAHVAAPVAHVPSFQGLEYASYAPKYDHEHYVSTHSIVA